MYGSVMSYFGDDKFGQTTDNPWSDYQFPGPNSEPVQPVVPELPQSHAVPQPPFATEYNPYSFQPSNNAAYNAPVAGSVLPTENAHSTLPEATNTVKNGPIAGSLFTDSNAAEDETSLRNASSTSSYDSAQVSTDELSYESFKDDFREFGFNFSSSFCSIELTIIKTNKSSERCFIRYPETNAF